MLQRSGGNLDSIWCFGDLVATWSRSGVPLLLSAVVAAGGCSRCPRR